MGSANSKADTSATYDNLPKLLEEAGETDKDREQKELYHVNMLMTSAAIGPEERQRLKMSIVKSRAGSELSDMIS